MFKLTLFFKASQVKQLNASVIQVSHEGSHSIQLTYPSSYVPLKQMHYFDEVNCLNEPVGQPMHFDTSD